MMKIKIVLIISLLICFFSIQAYGATEEPVNADKLIDDLKSTYGIKVIIQDKDDNINYNDCLIVLDKGLSRFPDGLIKEITDYYAKKEISTNIIVNKTEKISDLFSEYVMSDSSANIYINTLLYRNSCVASEEGFIYETGHFIRDYIFEIYGYDKLKSEFEKLNSGYNYGTWAEGYENIFLNKHAAASFKEEVANLIWYTEIHPDKLRNISDGNFTIIHKKIEILSNAAEQSFSSVTKETNLWNEALPQKPDEWARETIEKMETASLIPEEYEGIYRAYITKKDFYNLTFSIIEKKIGKESFSNTFGIVEKEEYTSLDPLKGEAYVNIDVYDSDEDNYITRLEIAKFFGYVSNKLNKDISDYKIVEFDDISSVSESEKLFIYYVSSNGLLNGNGTSFKPFKNCTYQESYLMLMRLYNFL
ncbi:hypothetical protein HZF24_14415 [Sedimentibacter hydroxybenzoicus DSM 7310]|uniref:SLH domain-containing protein n=1 Tax=Sedimentibacter hydroxybenzoicus DSM 7310 TaxID=1123245 RepID=A0A974GXA4_SEDHY|nr:hypothetical protein [Sedimentibacter hydroxybenzoicus]NYB75338.1 hypothetical protein [Sedimentibacter hydroxybenzoicus DSM 7310]